MAEHDNQQGYFFMGLLLGSVLGALAGIFFAPKSEKNCGLISRRKGARF